MRLAALLLASVCATAASAQDVRESFPLTLDNGRGITVHLRKPADARGPIPAIMLLGGFQRGDKVLDLLPDDLPLIRTTFDYPFDPPRKLRFPDSLKHLPLACAAIRDTFAGLDKLTQELQRRPDVDAARIIVIGASAGAPFATVAAANNGIPGVILVQGFADVPRVFHRLFMRKLEQRDLAWLSPLAWAVAHLLDWYCGIPDIAAHAARLGDGQRVLLFSAENDDFIPRKASDLVWEKLQASDAAVTRILQEGRHLRPDNAHEIERLLEQSFAWMKLNGLID